MCVHVVSRRSSFNRLTVWLTEARNQTHPNTIVLLIGNKTDLEKREVPFEEASRFAEENGMGGMLLLAFACVGVYVCIFSRDGVFVVCMCLLCFKKAPSCFLMFVLGVCVCACVGIMYLETSAKTGENVQEAFLRTARLIYKHIVDGSYVCSFTHTHTHIHFCSVCLHVSLVRVFASHQPQLTVTQIHNIQHTITHLV